MWNLWGIPFIKLETSLLGSHTSWQSLASKRCHKRLICCISVAVLMMLNQVSIVVVRQDGLMQLLHKLLFDPIQLFFNAAVILMLGSLSNFPVGAPRSLFLAASSNFRSISGDRFLSLSQHSQLDTLHQRLISNISQTGLHLSKQLLILKWARQVSSCSHTVSMASSDFHWRQPSPVHVRKCSGWCLEILDELSLVIGETR